MSCAPPLTELLHWHLTEFGTGNDGLWAYPIAGDPGALRMSPMTARARARAWSHRCAYHLSAPSSWTASLVVVVGFRVVLTPSHRTP